MNSTAASTVSPNAPASMNMDCWFFCASARSLARCVARVCSSAWICRYPFATASAFVDVELVSAARHRAARNTTRLAAAKILKKPDFLPGVFGFHEVWHIFVILGALSHFIVIAAFIAP